MSHRIAVLSGDGIGPEVMEEAIKVLHCIESKYSLELELKEADVGGIAIDRHGYALPESTLRVCRESSAILFGSVGGPKWELLPPDEQPERAALLPLRKTLDLYANLRPAIIFPSLISSSFLREDRLVKKTTETEKQIEGLDLLVVRELTSGIYFGQPKGREGNGKEEYAYDTMLYRRWEIERIAHKAFQSARKRKKKLTSIDKANVLTSMVFWREVVSSVALEYPDVAFESMYVDSGAMKLLSDPLYFDVLLCPNLFGDILSDASAMLTGSIGILPSASLSEGTFGLYEPVGGSAPDIAGRGIANPIAQILSLALLFLYSLGMKKIHDNIFSAVEKVLFEGYRTQDLIHSDHSGITLVSTSQMGEQIVQAIRQID